MPSTLWRYTLVELLRTVFMATAILVSVIAFAAAIKPLAEGALSPVGAVKFMALAVPPMLAYALPFSAGFGAALVYHRMAQDNETVASHSGGISHRSLLIPAACTALMLGGTLSTLNEWVIPRFLHSMERMISLDVAQLMIRQIERGQAAELGDVMIHAERIDEIDPPPELGARRMYLMHRVTAVQLNDDDEVDSDVTVAKAWLWTTPDPDDPEKTICRVQMEDGVYAPSDGGLRQVETGRWRAIRIPDAFEEDPKYLTFTELRELHRDPDRIGFVDVRRVRLAEAIARSRIRDRLARELADTRRLTLLGDGGRRYEITADSLVRAPEGALRLLRGDEPVRVRRYEPGEGGELTTSTDYAGFAWLRPEARGETRGASLWDEADESGPSLRFALQLVEVRTERPGREPVERTRRDFRSLRLAGDPLEELAQRSSAELLDEANAMEANGEGGELVPGVAADLSKMIAKLRREIVSKQQERMAMSVASAVMLMLGAITAMRLRDSLPLVVYLRSFFPALAMILLISSGQSYAHSSDVPLGVAVLWSGVAGGAIIAVFEFVKLARH